MTDYWDLSLHVFLKLCSKLYILILAMFHENLEMLKTRCTCTIHVQRTMLHGLNNIWNVVSDSTEDHYVINFIVQLVYTRVFIQRDTHEAVHVRVCKQTLACVSMHMYEYMYNSRTRVFAKLKFILVKVTVCILRVWLLSSITIS